jgi:hypothetical protein
LGLSLGTQVFAIRNLLIFVDRASKQYYCPIVKLRLSCLPVPCHSKEQAIKKFIEALSVVIVVAAALKKHTDPTWSNQ